ncbi:hypothetical protein LOD99_732 [Oopsacas minuta]|uniref:SH3 domain-containing protein n=1 Tax=Oopsacas minuta TaxID=111878 RepID=A0AAV7K179_9METZ|nr:hypothetical protein LOD99_732 [Oopsacas minuta]
MFSSLTLDDSDEEPYERVPSVDLAEDNMYKAPDPRVIPISLSSFQDGGDMDGETPVNTISESPNEQLEEIFEPLSIATPARSESMTEKSKGQVKLCVSLFDYAAQDTQDLSFKKGDIMELKNWADRDWWQATLRGKTGFVPYNYVHTLEENEEIYIALYDFQPQTREEIKLKLGQLVFVSRSEGDGWLHGTDGIERGIFPAAYVEHFEQKKKYFIHSS